MQVAVNSTCDCSTDFRYGASLMNALHRLGTLLVLALLLAGPSSVSAATKVGNVVFTRGAVSAQDVKQQLRLLGRRSPLYQGDIITTGPRSFAVIKLADGGRMSLRPNTVFTVKHFSQKKNASSLLMNLFKGGLRMISGLISKRNPNGVKLRAAGVTIGIRGTEFDARICKTDCKNNLSSEASAQATPPPLVIGRVALKKGAVSATNLNNHRRVISRGAPLYEGDTIETGRGAYAVLATRDRGRITLRPNTAFKIDKLRYSPPEKKQKKSFFGAAFSLLKGGVRVLTGLIGKTNPKGFRIRTSQATIGIRGTGFDLTDLGPCTSSTTACGLVASVWLGSITADNGKGSWEIKLDQNVQIPGQNAALIFIKAPPTFKVPRPDKVKIDFDNLFKAEKLSEAKPGVYVSCNEGHCALTNKEGKTIDLGVGESAFSSEKGNVLVRFEQVQPFQAKDLYLKTINRQFESLYEIFDKTATDKNKFQCTVQ